MQSQLVNFSSCCAGEGDGGGIAELFDGGLFQYSANHTVTPAQDRAVICMNPPGAGGLVAALPDHADVEIGFAVLIYKNSGATGTVTVSGGGGMIYGPGDGNVIKSNGQSLMAIKADASTWFLFGFTLPSPNPLINGGTGASDAPTARANLGAAALNHKVQHQSGGADELALAANQVVSGQFVMARLASGVPNGSKFIRDDGVLAVPAAAGIGGNVGPVDGQVPRADGGSGLLLQDSALNIADDSTIKVGTGGNPRGGQARDWQTSRASNDQVASGQRSCIANGQNNKSASDDGFITGRAGELNSAESFGGGGNTNIVGPGAPYSGWLAGRAAYIGDDQSATVAGYLLKATGFDSIALGGEEGEAAALLSAVMGYQGRATHVGEFTIGFGKFAGLGDAQRSGFPFRVLTSDVGPVEFPLMGQPGAFLTIDKDEVLDCRATVVAKASGPNWAVWRNRLFTIYNDAGTTAIEDGFTGSPPDKSLGSLAAALLDATADDVNDRLALFGTGLPGVDVYWAAYVEAVKVHKG